MSENLRPKHIPSFGRRGGKTIKESQRSNVANGLCELELKLPDFDAGLSSVFPDKSEIWLEIGFGGGEHLAHRAKNNCDIGYIGSEVYKYGVAKLIDQISNDDIDNIRIFTEDARLMLDALADNSIDGVYILFPDPWPKRKHHKRRIINHETLSILARILKKHAKLNIATDHYGYAEWIFVQMNRCDDFIWLANSKSDWECEPENHIKTRYQEKNKAQTNYPLFLNFERI